MAYAYEDHLIPAEPCPVIEKFMRYAGLRPRPKIYVRETPPRFSESRELRTPEMTRIEKIVSE